MKGYPKFVATRQDYENLLKMPEFARRARAELKALLTADPAKVTRAISLVDPNKPEGEWVTEEIDNPNPIWQRLGFKSKKEMTDMAKPSVTEVTNGE